MMQLTRREKNGLISIIIFLIGWAIYAGLVEPTLTRIDTLQRVIPEKQNELEKVKQVSITYARLSNELETAAHHSANKSRVDLLPLVENWLRHYQISDQVIAMKPNDHVIDENTVESSVTIDWDGVKLEPLVGFLAAVRHAEAELRIKGLTIRKVDNSSGLLKVTVRICCLNIQSQPG